MHGLVSKVVRDDQLEIEVWNYCSSNCLSDTMTPAAAAAADDDNNNTNDNVCGAVVVAQSHCESSPGSYDEYGTAPRLGQTTRAVSLPVGCQQPHPPSPFIIITQPDR